MNFKIEYFKQNKNFGVAEDFARKKLLFLLRSLAKKTLCSDANEILGMLHTFRRS